MAQHVAVIDLKFQHRTTFVILISMAFCTVSSFPLGAPAGACLTMFPEHHDAQTQLERDVFIVSSDTLTYKPSQRIKISVHSPRGKLIKGIQIKAHRTEINQDEMVGSFENLVPADKLKHLSCQGLQNSVVTHANNFTVPAVEVTWVGPGINLGPIIFEVTVVESFYVFYFGLKSSVINPAPVSPPITYPPVIAETVNETTTPIDWGACGKTKGCLLYPRYCYGDDCKTGVSYVVSKNSNTATFEMMVQASEYVSLGFSDDMIMGDDQAISCSLLYDRITIQNGWNHPVKFYSQDVKTELTNLEASRNQDGNIYCRFTRPLVMSMSVTYDVYDPLRQVSLTFDLNKEYYLFLAWGDTFDTSEVLVYHYEMPVISETKVNFFDHSISRGSVMPQLVRAHSTMMAVAWMGFASLAFVMPRHYKHGFKGKTFCGIKLWFHIHRISAIFTFVLTVAGMVVVVVELEGKVTMKESAHTHMCLGFTVVALVCAQLLGGFIRPAPEKKIRPIFNFIHRHLGIAAMVTATAALVCAFKIIDYSDDARRFGERTVAVWTGLFVLLEIVHSGYKYFMQKFGAPPSRSEEYNLDKQSENQPEQTESSSHILLAVYILFIACSITAAVCMTLFF